ncbi:GNAT family N-acetyltransferase [Nocardioides sp.]|uniref:GNAT family N-acetyltransferase n=1 Tax=Nocardioides sp. TaxID=35761 RepID=UPI001A251C26|nr:GNAT family N-acetyltransferase [Nocardioides sp.]MBJ7359107.1 GNAT family N-acetyltransferase [Nocardioides sp.]
MSGTSTQLEITDLDPFDDAEFDEFHAVYEAAESFGREATATPWERDELRVALREEARRRFRHGLCGRVDGRIVVTGAVEGSLLDNLDIGEVRVHTLPEARRRGHGSAMVAACEQVARERGRTTLLGMCDWPFSGHPEGDGEPGIEFARKHGYAMALVEIQRRLDLPVEEETLDRLAADAAAHHAGYTLRSWSGPVPEELVQGWAEVTSTLMTEAPMGDIEREPQVADPQVVRESEALAFAQGRELYATAALDEDGTVVAYTNFGVNNEGSPRAYQWGTLVRPEHRGHRLGIAVKVANLRQLQRERPDLGQVVTWNAEVNSHMVGVNEAIGFVPVERSGEVQKRLGG